MKTGEIKNCINILKNKWKLKGRDKLLYLIGWDSGQYKSFWNMREMGKGSNIMVYGYTHIMYTPLLWSDGTGCHDLGFFNIEL